MVPYHTHYQAMECNVQHADAMQRGCAQLATNVRLASLGLGGVVTEWTLAVCVLPWVIEEAGLEPCCYVRTAQQVGEALLSLKKKGSSLIAVSKQTTAGW